jgi:hypothetical protein
VEQVPPVFALKPIYLLFLALSLKLLNRWLRNSGERVLLNNDPVNLYFSGVIR